MNELLTGLELDRAIATAKGRNLRPRTKDEIADTLYRCLCSSDGYGHADYEFNGQLFTGLPLSIGLQRAGRDRNATYSYTLWVERIDKPYQQAIEAHIAQAWLLQPVWHADPALALGLLEETGQQWKIHGYWHRPHETFLHYVEIGGVSLIGAMHSESFCEAIGNVWLHWKAREQGDV